MIRYDCHAHVYDHVTPVPSARYAPARPAPLDRWLALQSDHGIRGGVIVQVSFLGTDNGQLLGALSSLDRTRFAGVAVAPLDVTETELRRLSDGGVRGLRWNLVSGAAPPDPDDPVTRALFARLAAWGLHLEVQLESPRWADYLPALVRAAAPAKLPVVVDHMGLPALARAEDEPWLNALQGCDGRDLIFVKLSAPYRGRAGGAHLDRLTGLLPPDRLIWGSDWPHTRHEAVATYAGDLERLSPLIDDAAAARRLYGLG